MEVFAVTVFVSLLLGVLFAVLFAAERAGKRRGRGPEQAALLPLDDAPPPRRLSDNAQTKS